MAITLQEILSATHRRVILDTCALYPSLSLDALSEILNNLPALSSLPNRVTPDLLTDLGILQHEIKPAAAPLAAEPISTESLRRELEATHNRLRTHIDSILDESTISSKGVEAIQKLQSLDTKIIDQLNTLLQQSSGELLPEAIIIACMRKLGVKEEDINIIRS